MQLGNMMKAETFQHDRTATGGWGFRLNPSFTLASFASFLGNANRPESINTVQSKFRLQSQGLGKDDKGLVGNNVRVPGFCL